MMERRNLHQGIAIVIQQQNRAAARLLRRRREIRQRLMLLYSLFITMQGSRLSRNVWSVEKSNTWWNEVALKMGEATWKANFRISLRAFRFLCDQLQAMERSYSNLRKCIPLEKRVAIAIYKLSSSAEYRTVAHLFGVGKSSVCEILHEFCTLLVDKLMKEFIVFPTTLTATKEVIEGFETAWGFPQCVGAIDGTHIEIQPPGEHTTSYYCYKKFYSVVLLAVCNYAYKFQYISVGAPGKNNDSHVFKNSSLFQYLSDNPLWKSLSVPVGSTKVPACIIGDSAFSLMETLQKPYPESCSMSDCQRNYNYCLSRARRIVENAFGRLKARFRMLQMLEVEPQNFNRVIQACCVLNNICEILGDEVDSRWLSGNPELRRINMSNSVAGENDDASRAVRDAVAAKLFLTVP